MFLVLLLCGTFLPAQLHLELETFKTCLNQTGLWSESCAEAFGFINNTIGREATRRGTITPMATPGARNVRMSPLASSRSVRASRVPSLVLTGLHPSTRKPVLSEASPVLVATPAVALPVAAPTRQPDGIPAPPPRTLTPEHELSSGQITARHVALDLHSAAHSARGVLPRADSHLATAGRSKHLAAIANYISHASVDAAGSARPVAKAARGMKRTVQAAVARSLGSLVTAVRNEQSRQQEAAAYAAWLEESEPVLTTGTNI